MIDLELLPEIHDRAARLVETQPAFRTILGAHAYADAIRLEVGCDLYEIDGIPGAIYDDLRRDLIVSFEAAQLAAGIVTRHQLREPTGAAS